MTLGYPHPDHLCEVLTSEQVSEWYAYYTLHPFGPELADIRHAVLCCLINNRWRGKNERARNPEEFMLAKPQKPKAQSPDEMWQLLKGLDK